MKSLVLAGSEALSGFRVKALLEACAREAASQDIKQIQANYVYFIESKSALNDEILERTRALLNAGEEHQPSPGFFVIPRKGTISPWSSKATDIFRNCGIMDVLRVERGIYYELVGSDNETISLEKLQPALNLFHDRMVEGVYKDISDIFIHMDPAPCVTVDVLMGGKDALARANKEIGLALSDEEIDYLYREYKNAERNPTDVELVMFGQVNSEHCRHKIFNADWIVDGEKKDLSLFDMIRNTYKQNPKGALLAYSDNSAVIEGFTEAWFEISRNNEPKYKYNAVAKDIIMKVETHNHPTAIAPYPGASTGVGGEIRDEGATGTGSKTKAGLCGFMVSNLRIPDFVMPWETDYAEFPKRLASPLDIMLEGPIGGARFGNEFGRPQLTGFFKTFEERYNDRYRGYHKPIMIAGGMGNIKREHTHKKDIPEGAYVIQIGGPALRIGLGGGTASSMDSGSNLADLDFNSVQRDNAEMQRRCQEVIDACIALKKRNPILSIHDLGAGGLSNGCPELISETGAKFELRKVPNEDRSMSPMEIWCCEAQERYVMAVSPKDLDRFLELCARERCPVYVIGQASGDGNLVLYDDHFKNNPIDINLNVIFGKPPKMLRDVAHLSEKHASLDLSRVSIEEAARRVLQLPAVSNKTFLITIADRSITGMVARDQMVGPHQVPVADAAVTTSTFDTYRGEAMAIGERTNIALVSAPASGRMAVGEAITNIASACIAKIGDIKLSANWMCACGQPGEDANLFDTVKTVGMELCPELGIAIPVGKDSLSMRTLWDTSKGEEKMTAPMSLVVSSFAPVQDVRKTVTPDLKKVDDSLLILIDIGRKKNRLGGSALARVHNQLGNECADLDEPKDLVDFFGAIQELIRNDLLLAYHDRSDGGLFVTLAEMAIGGRLGMEIELNELGNDPLAIAFSEELGAVIQVLPDKLQEVNEILRKHNVDTMSSVLGKPTKKGRLTVSFGENDIYSEKVTKLNRLWSELTYRMQALRDNPDCAKQEYDNILDEKNPGMSFKVTFNSPPAIPTGAKPRMAILREQGVNGQVEMAAAFDRAGFSCIDVHMTDLLADRQTLKNFSGLVACGGFSYGDVLGAGSGWAKSVLYNEKLKRMFAEFFARTDTFSLGVCNGCQMLSQLKGIIPGAEAWPDFTGNRSEQFEARFVTVEIMKSPSIFFKGMEGSRLGVPVAHGEGLVDFSKTGSKKKAKKLLAARYVDNYGKATERYPFNPNGSEDGITGLTSKDGRATIMMPHPERAFRAIHLSYCLDTDPGEDAPFMQMFRNARSFV